MDTKSRRKRGFILGLCLLALLLAQVPVEAQGVVGMSSPDTVERGYSMTVTVTATGASAGVNGVELYLIYDAANFQFVKVNSTFLGTLGGSVTSPADGGLFEMQDTTGGVIQLLAVDIPYTPADNVIAVLEFTAKADANIGPISFQFKEGSFVQTINGRVDATNEKLVMEITGQTETPISDTPLPPAEETAPPAEPGIDVPYDPNNQITPEGQGTGDGDDYHIGALNSDPAATTKERRTEIVSKPTVPESKRTERKEEETKTPLRSVTGEPLYSPEDGMPLSKIPEGFQGSMERILEVNVPVAKSSEKELSLYYLRNSRGDEGFYTYEESTERFKFYDLEKEAEKESESKSRFTAKGENGNTWKILLVSLIGLSALSIMIFTIYRNIRLR